MLQLQTKRFFFLRGIRELQLRKVRYDLKPSTCHGSGETGPDDQREARGETRGEEASERGEQWYQVHRDAGHGEVLLRSERGFQGVHRGDDNGKQDLRAKGFTTPLELLRFHEFGGISGDHTRGIP